MEDSAAFGLGCTVVGIVQFAIGSSSIAVMNFAAQKQVINISIMLWNVSVDKLIIFIMISKSRVKSRVERCIKSGVLQIFCKCILCNIEPHCIAGADQSF